MQRKVIHRTFGGKLLLFAAVMLLFFSSCGEDGTGTKGNDTRAENVFAGESGQDTVLSELQVHFIDVGQGNATLILCGGEAMLIDAGDNDKGTKVQLYLQNQGVTQLAYVVGTHPDADHIGGLDVILTKFDCGTVIMPDVAADTATYRDVADAMRYRNYENTLPVVGDTYALGDAEFTIVAPNREYADDNNSSVGIILVHGDNAFLFTGDAEAEAEADILQNGIDISADVLLVGHHGSSTSATEAFVRAVMPEYAVISCGKDNPYGHPHEETLRTLEGCGAKVFRTDEQGTVVAISDGTEIIWNTEPQQDEYEAQLPESAEITYVLNKNTKKFHLPDCQSVDTIKEGNREDTTKSREEIIDAGYEPCKRCNP